MTSVVEYLGHPLFVVSIIAVLAVGSWAVLSLRREPRSSGDGPVRVVAQPVLAMGARGPDLREDCTATASPAVPEVTFVDVAGLDEALEELREIKDYLLDPERFIRLGATLPRGILLSGPPGTGKTLLTKALAGEAGVPFQVVSAASLVEVYVGVGSARIRKVFAEARRQAPSIVLLDELDAIGRVRSTQASGGNEERESALNQLLTEMDGFDPADGVLVIGATNRPDVLDPALLRPGRFDRRLVISPPDLRGRRDILAVHARGKPLSGDADLDSIARRTPGFTGADLANVMNEAALLSGRRNRSRVGSEELEEAIDRLMTGPQRPSRVISPKEKRVIAYHEAGHVLVGWCLAQGHDVHRVSVVARGSAHGYTLTVPTEDRVLVSQSELEAQLAVLLGGRAAEELVFTDPTTGAADDLERASFLASNMVTSYGMSDSVGPVSLGGAPGSPSASGGPRDATGAVADEVRRLITQAHARASSILARHRRHLDLLAETLIVNETLDKNEIDQLLAGITRDAQPVSNRPGRSAPLRERSSFSAQKRAPAAAPSGRRPGVPLAS